MSRAIARAWSSEGRASDRGCGGVSLRRLLSPLGNGLTAQDRLKTPNVFSRAKSRVTMSSSEMSNRVASAV